MTDDTIRAALDAAQKHASSFYSVGETAQIIAAFLRALPDHVAVRDPVYPCSHTLLPVVRDGLARAVEEVARHD